MFYFRVKNKTWPYLKFEQVDSIYIDEDSCMVICQNNNECKLMSNSVWEIEMYNDELEAEWYEISSDTVDR